MNTNELISSWKHQGDIKEKLVLHSTTEGNALQESLPNRAKCLTTFVLSLCFEIDFAFHAFEADEIRRE